MRDRKLSPWDFSGSPEAPTPKKKSTNDGLDTLWAVIKFFTYEWYWNIFMSFVDLVTGKGDQNRLPYYGENHKGSPW